MAVLEKAVVAEERANEEEIDERSGKLIA